MYTDQTTRIPLMRGMQTRFNGWVSEVDLALGELSFRDSHK